MAGFRTLDDAEVRGKRVLVRVDLNLPMADGKVTDLTRIRAALPTINDIADNGGRVILLAHFGRPQGKVDEKYSLRQVVSAVAEVLARPVAFADDCCGPMAEKAIAAMADGGVLILENTRFHAGEEENDPAFADQLAALGDVYVNDAFSAAHRAHASTEGIAHRLPAFAGRSMQAELEALDAALGNPQRPVAAIVGGAKVSTKIELLENLVAKVDALVIGGGMANTFLLAKGVEVGKSLAEADLADTARRIISAAEASNCTLILPDDVVVAATLAPHVSTQTVASAEVPADTMILDVGQATTAAINGWIDRAATLVWNGPLGAFETPPFDQATLAVARHAADRTTAGQLLSVAGGGDTVAALHKAGVAGQFSFVSTAGGAFLEWMEGKPLPGVEALNA